MMVGDWYRGAMLVNGDQHEAPRDRRRRLDGIGAVRHDLGRHGDRRVTLKDNARSRFDDRADRDRMHEFDIVGLGHDNGATGMPGRADVGRLAEELKRICAVKRSIAVLVFRKDEFQKADLTLRGCRRLHIRRRSFYFLFKSTVFTYGEIIKLLKLRIFVKQDREFCEVCEDAREDALKKAFMGVRLKRLREQHNLTQQALADRLGISLSYLNQIENNQRALTVPVLLKLNAAFGTDVQLFSDNDEARLIGELREALADPALGEMPALADIKELAFNMPALAHAFIAQARRLRQASDEIAAYSVRLGDHRQGDAAKLPSAPFEEVRDYFYANRNYIDELDRAGEATALEMGMPLGRMADAAARRLEEKHGLRLAELPQESDPGTVREYDEQARILRLSRWLGPGQRAFQLATQLALLEQSDLIDRLAARGSFSNEEARSLAKIGLANYFAGALMLPYTPFLRTAERLRYDVELLGMEFGTGFETVCHRLSTLQRPETRGVPFFFIRVDRAGNISKRQSATDFHFSRTGGTCPLWNVYDAFSHPGKTMTQIAEMPDGRAYLWVARMVESTRGGHGAPVKQFAIGLGCDLIHADRLVYSQGLSLNDPAARTPIGAGCKICERARCPQRAFPSMAKALIIDSRRTLFAPYPTA